MRQKLLNMLVALTAMAGSATAQTLSIAPIEAEAGAQAELVVTGASLSNAVTALQFNFTLPQGVTLDEAAVTKGAAASGHELSVSTLDGGARLFVLYNMNLDNIKDGELLRLPVSIGSDATGGNARLTTVRYASGQAVSTAGQDATAAITVRAPEQPVTVTANDLTMTYGDDVPALTYKTEGAALNGTPQLTTTATKTSPVGTYPITVAVGSVTNTKATYVAGTLTIKPAALTVGVQDASITEGDALPAFVLTYSGFRNDDTEATAFAATPQATTTATSASAAGTYPITVSGGSARNYTLSYTAGTLTVVKKEEPQPEGFSNQKLYTLTCKRGAMVMNADGTGLAAGQARTDAPEADKRFAIITYNDAQYLYSPVQKQFLLSDGSFASRLGTPVSFDDSHPDGDYTYMLTMQNAKGETLTFNNNGKIVINDWGTPDDGNRWRIEPVADFDPTEALALAAKQTCVVTYQVQYDGQPVASATEEVAIGSALPAVPARLTGAFVTLTPAGTLPTTVDTDVTISYTAVWKGPFAFSKSEADAHWYNMHIRSGYYVGKQATEPYYPAQVAADVLKTKEYHWAFGGTPYRIVVYNRATGFAETLTKDGGNAVMRPGEYFWEILPNADGFVLREEGTANNCVNQNGGSEGPLQFWSNAASPTDNGSTFRVEEARELETGIGHLDAARPRAGSSALYDLSGRRVYQPTQRGIYISNRRKVAVR